MDVREKLALSVCNATQKTNFKCEFNCEKKGKCAYCLVMADQMIAHGVTVQEWISVKDRLPEKPMKCLVYTKRGEYGGYEITYYNEGFYLQYANVTNWMPLPDEPEVKND